MPMKQEKYVLETLNKETKADIKKTINRIVISILTLYKIKQNKKKSVVKEAYNSEAEILYQGVSYLEKKHFKSNELRKYRAFTERCINSTQPLVETLLSGQKLSDIVDVHKLASICANLYDNTQLCVQCMVMTDFKELLKILEL